MKKTLLVLVLAFALLVSSFAMAEERVFQKYDEPVQVTIMGIDEKDSACVFDSSVHAWAGVNENCWIDAYKDYLNVEVTRIVPEDATALNASLNTMMASGDLPDVMIVPKEMFYVLAENGVLKDLRADFEAADGEYWSQIRNSYGDDIWSAGEYEGELLGMPYAENFYNGTSVMWIRKDWLAKVNMEVPTTIDELTAVAQAFVDNKLGGDNTIGIGLTGAGDWGTDYSSIMAAFGVQLQTWVEKDGKYVYSDTLDACKDGLLKLQEMYKQGLFKSDFAVSDILNEEVANGSCGLYFAPGWHGVTNINASLLNDENAEWTAAPIPTLDGNPVAQTTNATVNRFVVVNANYEHSDVIFRMKDLETCVYCSVGVNDPMYNLRAVDNEDGSIAFTTWNLMVFRGWQRGDMDLYRAALICEGVANNTPVEEMNVIAQSSYNNMLKWLNGGDRTQLRLYLTYCEGYPIVQKLVDAGLVVPGFNGPLTENMALYQTTINDALRGAMIKVIMGDDISVYEQGVADWYANGGQAITEEVNAFYGK